VGVIRIAEVFVMLLVFALLLVLASLSGTLVRGAQVRGASLGGIYATERYLLFQLLPSAGRTLGSGADVAMKELEGGITVKAAIVEDRH